MGEREFYYRRLPHWHPPNATFFVTFRLEGSLPRAVMMQLQDEYERERRSLEARPPEQRTPAQYDAYKKAFARFDRALAKANGPRWLADPRVAEIVQNELHALHPQICHLLAYCIMPNHVHLLVDMEGIPPPPPHKGGKVKVEVEEGRPYV
ncbi:MAG: hypothetical protein Kow0063_42330 [Anaerolineae bacterium]